MPVACILTNGPIRPKTPTTSRVVCVYVAATRRMSSVASLDSPVVWTPASDCVLASKPKEMTTFYRIFMIVMCASRNVDV